MCSLVESPARFTPAHTHLKQRLKWASCTLWGIQLRLHPPFRVLEFPRASSHHSKSTLCSLQPLLKSLFKEHNHQCHYNVFCTEHMTFGCMATHSYSWWHELRYPQRMTKVASVICFEIFYFNTHDLKIGLYSRPPLQKDRNRGGRRACNTQALSYTLQGELDQWGFQCPAESKKGELAELLLAEGGALFQWPVWSSWNMDRESMATGGCGGAVGTVCGQLLRDRWPVCIFLPH